MNDENKKGFFAIHDRIDKFHLGVCFCYDPYWKECYLFLCLGQHDFSIGYRWER